MNRWTLFVPLVLLAAAHGRAGTYQVSVEALCAPPALVARLQRDRAAGGRTEAQMSRIESALRAGRVRHLLAAAVLIEGGESAQLEAKLREEAITGYTPSLGGPLPETELATDRLTLEVRVVPAGARLAVKLHLDAVVRCPGAGVCRTPAGGIHASTSRRLSFDRTALVRAEHTEMLAGPAQGAGQLMWLVHVQPLAEPASLARPEPPGAVEERQQPEQSPMVLQATLRLVEAPANAVRQLKATNESTYPFVDPAVLQQLLASSRLLQVEHVRGGPNAIETVWKRASATRAYVGAYKPGATQPAREPDGQAQDPDRPPAWAAPQLKRLDAFQSGTVAFQRADAVSVQDERSVKRAQGRVELAHAALVPGAASVETRAGPVELPGVRSFRMATALTVPTARAVVLGEWSTGWLDRVAGFACDTGSASDADLEQTPPPSRASGQARPSDRAPKSPQRRLWILCVRPEAAGIRQPVAVEEPAE